MANMSRLPTIDKEKLNGCMIGQPGDHQEVETRDIALLCMLPSGDLDHLIIASPRTLLIVYLTIP